MSKWWSRGEDGRKASGVDKAGHFSFFQPMEGAEQEDREGIKKYEVESVALCNGATLEEEKKKDGWKRGM